MEKGGHLARAIALIGIFALGGCLGDDPDAGERTFRPGDLPAGGITSAGQAYPRQVIAISSQPDQRRKLTWDPDMSTERRLTKDHYSRYVEIPEDAAPGEHFIRITRPGTPDKLVRIEVLAQPLESFPLPRIDDVAVSNVNAVAIYGEPTTVCLDKEEAARYAGDHGKPRCFASSAAVVTATIFLTAANADIDAGITVQATGKGADAREKLLKVRVGPLYGALPLKIMQQRRPETYGYPIFHFTQFRVVVEGLVSGTEYTIGLENRPSPGVSALPRQHKFLVPSSPDRVDSDNDRLSDVVEENLRRQGIPANPFRKTILVEVDYLANAAPDTLIWPIARRAFSGAPVLNPDGSRGIDLYIDHGQDRANGGPFSGGGALPPFYNVSFLALSDCGWNSFLGCVTLPQIKERYFDPARKDKFHYAVFGPLSPSFSGGMGYIDGWDFIVTSWRGPLGKAGTFVHELGHNLNLMHSGHASIDRGDPKDSKDDKSEFSSWTPNTPSTMSYRWQLTGPDTDCDYVSDNRHTFSMGMYRNFDESNTSERDGVCDNRGVDIDQDGDIEDTPPTAATSYKHCWAPFFPEGCDDDADDVHRDGNQWGTVAYRPLHPLCRVGTINCRPWIVEGN